MDYPQIALTFVLYCAGALIGSAALYCFMQALSIPYQNKTDRLWKTAEDEEEDVA